MLCPPRIDSARLVQRPTATPATPSSRMVPSMGASANGMRNRAVCSGRSPVVSAARSVAQPSANETPDITQSMPTCRFSVAMPGRAMRSIKPEANVPVRRSIALPTSDIVVCMSCRGAPLPCRPSNSTVVAHSRRPKPRPIAGCFFHGTLALALPASFWRFFDF